MNASKKTVRSGCGAIGFFKTAPSFFLSSLVCSILILIFSFNHQALAGGIPIGGTSGDYYEPENDAAIELPKYLFHWASPESLKQMAEEADIKNQRITLKTLAGSAFVLRYKTPMDYINKINIEHPDLNTSRAGRALLLNLGLRSLDKPVDCYLNWSSI